MDGVLVVVPLRGGSTRLPRKNVKLVAGRPLMWYTLDLLSAEGVANNSVVITDDDEIESTSRRDFPHINVVREPRTAAGNMPMALYRAVDQHSAKETIDTVVLAHCCAPLRPFGLLEKCVDFSRQWSEDRGAVATVVETCRPREWFFRLKEGGYPDPAPNMRLSQQYSPTYTFSGCYVCHRRSRFDTPPKSAAAFNRGSRRRCVEHEGPLVDIDYEDELQYFEFLVTSGKTPWRVSKIAESLR